ncbi:MAG TPA: cyanophycin synthetase [Acidimicrobiales bacterium]
MPGPGHGSFEDAVAFLDDHINLERTVAVAGRIEHLSLDKMRRIAHVLGDPQEAYPVIHLTGTNGKGSTARMISALLAAHSLSVGTYTSPHLEHVTERIAWNLDPISLEDFGQVVGDLVALEPLLLEELGEPPSYFELLTAAAFAYFAQVAVDVAVVEVGLLGRFDATNVATAQVAVITNVGKDHTDAVGDWRRKTATEKAGIITPGHPLILGEADPDLLPIFEAEGPAPVWLQERDFRCESDRIAIGGHVVDLRTPLGLYEELLLPVHGAHQVDNAGCALAAVEALFGRELDVEVVREAFAGLTLPGRFEVVHRGPLLVLDSAHNPDGARAAGETLEDEFDVAGRRRWVIGVLAGRDVDEMLDGYGVRTGDEVMACTPDTPRAVPAADLAAAVARRGVEARLVPDVAEALTLTWKEAMAAGDADLVMVTGSLYTVGAARTACRRLGLL